MATHSMVQNMVEVAAGRVTYMAAKDALAGYKTEIAAHSMDHDACPIYMVDYSINTSLLSSENTPSHLLFSYLRFFLLCFC